MFILFVNRVNCMPFAVLFVVVQRLKMYNYMRTQYDISTACHHHHHHHHTILNKLHPRQVIWLRKHFWTNLTRHVWRKFLGPMFYPDWFLGHQLYTIIFLMFGIFFMDNYQGRFHLTKEDSTWPHLIRYLSICWLAWNRTWQSLHGL